MSYEEQKGVVWALIGKLVDDDGHVHLCERGGALCFTINGHLLTAFHVIGSKEVWNSIGGTIQARSNKNGDLRDFEYLEEFPTLDVSILKIKSKPGEKFFYRHLTDTISLEDGVPMVVHGHSAGTLFSSWFGTTSYHYKRLGDLRDRFEDLELTYENHEEDLCVIARKNLPLPLYRSVAGIVSKEDSDLGEMLGYHPKLPLIEIGTPILEGYSGCPVFRKSNGELVGLVSFKANCFTYVLPSDVLYYIIYKLTDLPSQARR